MVRFNETGSYEDCGADLSIDEARHLHEKYKPAATTGIYNCEEWQRRIQPKVRELDAALSPSNTPVTRFHLCVFEWESGLG